LKSYHRITLNRDKISLLTNENSRGDRKGGKSAEEKEKGNFNKETFVIKVVRCHQK